MKRKNEAPLYESPHIEIVNISARDVLTTSGNGYADEKWEEHLPENGWT